MLVSFGCTQSWDPASYVTGLRVLAIKAEPPEVPPGQSATLTALAVDTLSRPLTVVWGECTQLPLQGQDVSPGCLLNPDGGAVAPVGSGLQVAVTMPASASPQSLGLPDATGGVYLPLVAQATAGSDSLNATYRLRLGSGAPANQNPQLSGVYMVAAGSSGNSDAGSPGAGDVLTALDPNTPLPVYSGEKLTLRVTFAPGSAETYQIPAPGSSGDIMPRTVQESLSVSYFGTAGSLSQGTTGVDRPDAILSFDKHLPPSGGTIDLWVVGRDERGGSDYLHRTLALQ